MTDNMRIQKEIYDFYAEAQQQAVGATGTSLTNNTGTDGLAAGGGGGGGASTTINTFSSPNTYFTQGQQQAIGRIPQPMGQWSPYDPLNDIPLKELKKRVKELERAQEKVEEKKKTSDLKKMLEGLL